MSFWLELHCDVRHQAIGCWSDSGEYPDGMAQNPQESILRVSKAITREARRRGAGLRRRGNGSALFAKGMYK